MASSVEAEIHVLNYFAQILCYKNRESIDIIVILHFYERQLHVGMKADLSFNLRHFVAYEIVHTAEIIEKNGLSFQDLCGAIRTQRKSANLDF